MTSIFEKLKAAEAARKAAAGESPAEPQAHAALSARLQAAKPAQVASLTAPVAVHRAGIEPARQIPSSMGGTGNFDLDDLPNGDDEDDEDDFDDDDAEFDDDNDDEVAVSEDAPECAMTDSADQSTGTLPPQSPASMPEKPQPKPLQSLRLPSASTKMKPPLLSEPATEATQEPQENPPETPSPTLSKTPLPTLPATSTGFRLSHPASQKSPPQPQTSSPLSNPEPAPSTEPASQNQQVVAAIAGGGPLAALLKRKTESANETTNRLAVTSGASACIDAGEAAITPQQFLDEWNNLGDDVDLVPDLQEQRVALLDRVAERIRQVFATEMGRLATGSANERSIQELSQLVRLTFIRVKEAPSAWTVLDRQNKTAVIEAMVALAVKRNSAVKTRKPKEAAALSSAMETMIVGDAGIAEILDEALGDFTFDI